MCSRQFNLKKLEAPNKAQIIVMLTGAEDNTERPPYGHGDDARHEDDMNACLKEPQL
jgi:hypothetical protein